jgi:hypothetical protein
MKPNALEWSHFPSILFVIEWNDNIPFAIITVVHFIEFGRSINLAFRDRLAVLPAARIFTRICTVSRHFAISRRTGSV